ncbi:hypothetical protein [Aureimonas leprariae]|uniref:Uncharacterized protein n=1 Tax=Plantimonas leprariae TaxID=2615207 RepID=A0A7V7TZ23_9HYPH|nr:hypothetical protein [Aureimonas leprariae]KAB0678548.1 hypothetical protein F6X38_16120 [Aureimonas leprariae]
MFHSSTARLGFILSTLLFSTLAGPAPAGMPTTLGSMRFEAPDAGSGWVAKPVKGGTLYQKQFPPDEKNRRKGAAIIQILGPFAGTPATLDKGFETVAAGVKGLEKERPYLKSEGVTTNGHRIRTDYRCCAEMQGLSVGQRTVGIASAKAQVVLALVGLELHDAAKRSADADFEALVRSVALEAGDKPFALEPRPGDGGLDGVYTHLDTGVRPNAFGGMDFYSDSEITVFGTSGLYATELPQDGDLAVHCRAEPTDCGLYALQGGGFFSGASRIEMREVSDAFGTIETEAKPFARKGDGLEIDGGAYSRIPPFAAGTTFDGTWRYFYAAVGSTAFSSNSVSSERLLTLRRDGSFRRDGWSGASGTNDTGTGTVGFTTGGNRPAASGRYKVEGYALELAGDDGRTERLSIFAPDKDSDKLLVIGGSNYLKRD